MSKIKDLLKEWRILLVIFSVVVAIFLIGISLGGGVIVRSVSTDSPLYDKLVVGEAITWANEREIKTPEDFYAFESYTGVFRYLHSGKLDLVQIDTPGLGVTIEQKPFSNINFGLDLVGGTRVLLKPTENVTDQVVQQIIATLETRINVFGLREAKFQQVNDITGNKFVQIETVGSRQELENLLAKQGKFEAKIGREVIFSNSTSNLTLTFPHVIRYDNGSIVVDGTRLGENQTSQLEGIDYEVLNLSDKNVTLFFSIFTGKDIQSVCIQDQPGICTSRLFQQNGGWAFNFQVFITQEGTERFAKVTNTSRIISIPGVSDRRLEDDIMFFLDENLTTQLSISAELKGVALTTPAITGSRATRDEALREKLTLQSILQSGSLPVPVEIIKVDQISPTLGAEFFRAAILAAITASIVVSGVIFVRYKKIKILIPMVLFSVTELVLTLGVSALIKWTIDLSSIAGLIAAIGTGTNDQIIIVDEILEGGTEKKIYTVKQRVKRAFFIVFGAASTIIAAMLPLMFIGVGVMRGFAIVTTIGVLIGVFITRPAFAKIAEVVLEEPKTPATV